MRKLFSFMGTGRYQEVSYFINDADGKTQTTRTRFILEAVIEHLIKNGDLTVYLFLTKEAKAENYLGGHVHPDQPSVVSFMERQKILAEKYPDKLNFVILEDVAQGKNADEIWDIFYQITNHVAKNDQIYVDITHAFRSLPFLMTGILNYASFCHTSLKVEEIFYGIYEKGAETAAILKLSEYIRLQEWTTAVDKCLTGGQSEICNLIKAETELLKMSQRQHFPVDHMESLEKHLRLYLESLKTCRVKENIVAALALKADFEALDRFTQNNVTDFKGLKPFFYILQKLKTMVENYQANDLINNTYVMAKQCRAFGLYQQVFVLIRENIVNCLMVNMVKVEADFYNYQEREDVVNNYLKIDRYGKNAVNNGDYYFQNIPSSYMSKNAINFYRNGNRNDVSHAGMEQKPISSEEIVKEAQRAINQFEGLFLKFLPGREEQQ